ncbi:DNA polymerase III subunit gamma and tau [Nocardia sp. GCM10030253]|uniref:DNA polymerase III subunit gamma and tau n=1 Tax=Nocardia sp. GCM10030253 TaxID=3273404 RepID=UPI00362F79E2
MALYRKYRPATFAEVVGQEHVTDPLSIALDTGRISHAYLFSGPRGCGKTSSARILARSLNCVHGPTSKPCGVCPSCVALGPGGPGNLDVIELDAASHGGVDDTRELRDRAFYAPAESRYRVFIVDEAHMVTTAGFNALLKIVEEPPAHLIFIFATTEPDKVLPTIRSRTHHYPFRLLPPATMRGLLGKICEQENVPVDEAVYPLVIRAGGGSPRDSLSVLDQLLAGAGPEGVTYPRAVSLLGVTDVALIDDAIDALATGDGAALFGTIDRVMEAGHDPRRFAVDLLERLRDLILLRAVPDAADRGLVSGPGDVLERMRDQAQRLGPATLARHAELLHEGLGEMRGATAPRLLLEIVCARMLLPSVSDAESATLQRIEQLERGIAGGVVPRATGAVAAAPASAQGAQAAAPGSAAEAPRRRGAELLAAARRETRAAGAGAVPDPSAASQANVASQTGTTSQTGVAPQASAASQTGAAPQASAASQTGVAPQASAASQTGAAPQASAAPQSASVAERAPIPGSSPVVGRAPEDGQVLASGQAPATERAPAAGQGSVSDRSPIAEQPPVAENASAAESAQVAGQAMAAERVPEQGPAAEHAAVAERAQVTGRAAAAERVSGQEPVVERAPAAGHAPGQGPAAERAAVVERAQVTGRAAAAERVSGQEPVVERAPAAGHAPGQASGADTAERAPGAGQASAAESSAVSEPIAAAERATGASSTGYSESAAAQSISPQPAAGRPVVESESPAPAPVAAPAQQEADLLRAVEAAWADIRAKVREFGPTVQALLSGASVSRLEGNVIVFAHQHAPLAQRLSDPRNLEAVRSAVRAVLGRDHEVRWEAGAPAPRPAATASGAGRTRGAGGRESGSASTREPGGAAGRSSDAAAPPRFSRPSQARGAASDPAAGGGGHRPSDSPDVRQRAAEDDIPPPDFPDLPDDPGPVDYAPVDGVPPAATPEEEQEMLAESATPVAPGERRDPDEIALELLRSELGATRLDG